MDKCESVKNLDNLPADRQVCKFSELQEVILDFELRNHFHIFILPHFHICSPVFRL